METMSFRFAVDQPVCQLSNTPVAHPKRKSWLTFMISSVQNLSVSKISLEKSSVVTPPVRSSMASLEGVSAEASRLCCTYPVKPP